MHFGGRLLKQASQSTHWFACLWIFLPGLDEGISQKDPKKLYKHPILVGRFSPFPQKIRQLGQVLQYLLHRWLNHSQKEKRCQRLNICSNYNLQKKQKIITNRSQWPGISSQQKTPFANDIRSSVKHSSAFKR